MLRGQMSVGFMTRTAVGFILVIGLAYAVLSMNESLKKEAQEQTLVSAAKYVAVQTFASLEELEEGQRMNKTLKLPVFRDETVTPYAVSFEDVDGELFVRASSMQWRLMARHPLYLNSSHVTTNSLVSYPPKMCITLSRNSTYQLNVTC